uniref:Uncharacterized protein n=1 Tax=Timema monikensis TaxID=170555 RepID=A0A7R9E6P0_9NEOP|nr:unnamed protein product [Timema monikensis]
MVPADGPNARRSVTVKLTLQSPVSQSSRTPPSFFRFYPYFYLEELRLDRNVISDLPEALGRLGRLRILTIGYNCLQELPSFLLVMRALALLDFQGNRVDNEKLPPAPAKDEASLARINLRANLLKGNIVLGNYGVSQPGLKLMSLRCGAAILPNSGRFT